LTPTHWDTAGQERFGTITSSIYRKAKGVAYVYDVSREETFGNLKMWMEEVTRKYNEVQTTNTVIIGNKCDLPAKVPLEVVQKFAADHKATFIQTSAKTGENIEAIFTTLAKGFEEKGGSSTDVGPTRLRGETASPSVIRDTKKKKSVCSLL
jgi:Ras-related protein Rab-18